LHHRYLHSFPTRRSSDLSEVAIEAAVSQPGCLHDVGNADPVVTMLTQQARRSLDDLLAVLLRLFSRHPHVLLTLLAAGPDLRLMVRAMTQRSQIRKNSA